MIRPVELRIKAHLVKGEDIAFFSFCTHSDLILMLALIAA